MQVEKQAKIGNANQNNLLNNYSSVSSKKDSRQFRKAMPLSVKNTSHQVACYPPTKKQPARKESSHQTKSTIQQHPAPSSS